MRPVLAILTTCLLLHIGLISCSLKDKVAPLSPVSPATTEPAASHMTVSIESKHLIMPGQNVAVAVMLDTSESFQIGGFDLLIAYDNTALTLADVVSTGSPLYDICGWEYFTYTTVASEVGWLVHVVALAETNNGDQHPSCFSPPADPGLLFSLKFLVSSNRALDCQFIPIRFYWQNCTHNVFSTTGGDTLLLSRYVFESSRIDNDSIGFPTYRGTQELCAGGGTGGTAAVRAVDFYNGGIEMVCDIDIDPRGDLNLDGIQYELTDLILFSQFFIHGVSVFSILPEAQIATTDVNADGLVLTVADYVTVADIVMGLMAPSSYPPEPPTTCRFAYFNDTLWVDSTLGAAYLVFEGNIVPELLADSVAMCYNFDGTYTRVLITPPLEPVVYEEFPRRFSGVFLAAHGTLASIEAARPDGRGVIGKLLPEAFGTGQNFPNPFEQFTTIPFRMAESGRYTITIFDAQGRQKSQFSDSVEAGYYSVEWDSGDAPAGLYTYLFTGGGAEQKRVMIKTG